MPPTLADFLEARATMAADISWDGAWTLLSSNLGGTFQLYRQPGAGGDLEQLTAEAEPVSGRFIPHRASVLVSRDNGGDERHQLYLLDGPGAALTPLVTDPEHIHRLGAISRDGRQLLYVTNRRNGVDFDVVVRNLISGEERTVVDRGGWWEGLGFSPDGRFAVAGVATDRTMDNDLYLADLRDGGLVHVSPHHDDAEFSTPAWLAHSAAFLMPTNSGRDFIGIARCEVGAAGWRHVLETGWDAGCWTSDDGRQLLVATNEDGETRLELFDAESMVTRGPLPLPGRGVAWRPGVVPDPRWSPDGASVVVTQTSPTVPADVWRLPVDGGDPVRLTSSPSALRPADCVAPELHRIASFDGEVIPAFLYRPTPGGDGPPPVVVVIHGGPESQSTPSWNPVVQYLAAQGYAVVVPNVRGSTGYGRRFTHLDDVRLRLDSVRDLSALHGWLAGVGLDASRAALYGGSYGGYMVLAGLAFQPELWAAGVDVVGISSLVTFLANTSPWRRAIREREYGSLEHDRDFLVEASPITHVDRMRAPLLMIHGSNDPRVPLSEAEQLHAVLRDKGIECELLVYPDEGHGLAKLANRLDAYPRVVAFLDRVLRGG